MNQNIMELITTALHQTGHFLTTKHITGDYKYIAGSAMISSDLHTEYDHLANDKLLAVLLPELFSILPMDEMLIISEEADKPYLINQQMDIWYPDDITLYPGWVLVLDPICGSIPFARGVSDYIISIGIMHQLSCVYAGIYQPDLDELFYAERGQGAYLNGKAMAAMSNVERLEMTYLSIEHKVFREAPPQDIHNIANNVMRIRTAGTCSLEMCYVACGRLDGLIKLKQSFYDYLPGSLILLESNPHQTLVALDGLTPLFPLKALNQKASFLATNGKINAALAAFTAFWEK